MSTFHSLDHVVWAVFRIDLRAFALEVRSINSPSPSVVVDPWLLDWWTAAAYRRIIGMYIRRVYLE